MSAISITRTSSPRVKPDPSAMGFGKYFSDHMFLMDYQEGSGWHSPRIVPYGPFVLEPSAMVFHYAQEIFEGMKAYRAADGAQLFRPADNVRRLNESCARMCIPPLPEDLVLAGIKALVRLDEDWIPSLPATSLYIRPFVFATDASLGVHASHSYIFCVITSPVGSYYPTGINPVKILIESSDVRAVRGGTGTAKTGGNYAASIRAGARAEALGYTQVLWLDGVARKYVEEVGSMNVLFKINGQVVTPELQGSVLPGITRRSCLDLLRSWEIPVCERLVSAEELFQAAEDGSLEEAWGSGTAAVISPIGEMAWDDRRIVVNGGEVGPLTRRLYDNLTGIQWGTLPDPFGWVVKL